MFENFQWNNQKNDELIARYGFGFDRIMIALSDGDVVDDRIHTNRDRYPNQRQILVDIDAYIWVVPYVQTDVGLFLKTFFPSRKATKQYLKGAK